MSVLGITILSALGLGSICLLIETWIRRREHDAAETERARIAAESARLGHQELAERVRAQSQINAEAKHKLEIVDEDAAKRRAEAREDQEAAERALEARTREPWI